MGEHWYRGSFRWVSFSFSFLFLLSWRVWYGRWSKVLWVDISFGYGYGMGVGGGREGLGQ